MKIEILDTKTGKQKTIETDFSPFWWAEGNGSCDCNRAGIIGCSDELDFEMRKSHPELKEWQGHCYGFRRFLIISSDSEEYTLEEYNSDYSEELKRKHLTNGGVECTN